MRVLLVEEDARASGTVERGLDRLGFQVEVANGGRRALHQALRGGHDVVVLDLLQPERNGSHMLAELRRRKALVPVLVLSERNGVSDRVRALDGGADDYMVKPYDFDELVARIRALGRRQSIAPGQVLVIADLRMDLQTRRVERGSCSISLTRQEFSLLQYMLTHRDIVLTRTRIAEHVWGHDTDSLSNVIDVYIRYLRAKIDAGSDSKLIHTVRGVGYVLSERRP